MNWRMKLADWISGGQITFYREAWRKSIGFHGEAALQRDTAQAESQARLAIIKERDFTIKNLTEVNSRYNDLCTGRIRTWGRALREIEACETPKANATVKRMARMAREALE